MIHKQPASAHSCDYRSSVVLHKHVLNVNVSYSVRNKGEGGTCWGYQVKGHVLIFSFKESRLQLQGHTHTHTHTHSHSAHLFSVRAGSAGLLSERVFLCRYIQIIEIIMKASSDHLWGWQDVLIHSFCDRGFSFVSQNFLFVYRISWYI